LNGRLPEFFWRESSYGPKISGRSQQNPEKRPFTIDFTDGEEDPVQNPVQPIGPGTPALKFFPRNFFGLKVPGRKNFRRES